MQATTRLIPVHLAAHPKLRELTTPEMLLIDGGISDTEKLAFKFGLRIACAFGVAGVIGFGLACGAYYLATH